MQEKLKQLKNFNIRLFCSLCALALIPAIYQTVKTYIISTGVQSSVFDILGQMEWFDLINETLQAFLIIPLYSILNKIFKNDRANFSNHVFKTGLIAFLLYALFSIGVLIYGVKLIRVMNREDFNISATNSYLRMETLAFMIGIIVSFFNVVFIVVGKAKNIYLFLAIKIFLSIIADFSLIPNFGVYGVAASNIITNFVLASASFCLLYIQKHIKPCLFHKTDLLILKDWTKSGLFAGLQQFIDNLIYAVMICKMVNMVAEQGNYWIANNFIWGWMLISISALGEVIRRDCKDGYQNLKQFNYYFVVLTTIILWIFTVPLWLWFFRYVENLQNAEVIFTITLSLLRFTSLMPVTP